MTPPASHRSKTKDSATGPYNPSLTKQTLEVVIVKPYVAALIGHRQLSMVTNQLPPRMGFWFDCRHARKATKMSRRKKEEHLDQTAGTLLGGYDAWTCYSGRRHLLPITVRGCLRNSCPLLGFITLSPREPHRAMQLPELIHFEIAERRLCAVFCDNQGVSRW